MRPRVGRLLRLKRGGDAISLLRARARQWVPETGLLRNSAASTVLQRWRFLFFKFFFAERL
jgi:hypothetical protein